MVTVRRPLPAATPDYAAVVQLENEIWPEYPSTVDEWKHDDQARDPGFWFYRYVTLLDGTLVGSGHCGDARSSHKPGKFVIQVQVLPAFRRQGVGAALYEHGLAAIAQRAGPLQLLESRTREDQEAGLRFLTRRGFEQVMRYPVSELSLAAFDPAAFTGVVTRVQSRGIEILSLRGLAAQEPEWQRQIHDLYVRKIMPDVPKPDPYTPQTFEHFAAGFLENPNFNPDAIFVAREGGQLVGTTGFWRPEAFNGTLFTILTGVVRSHRRQGIALALKVVSIRWAKAYGATLIETDNQEDNPMYQLNLRLGFKPKAAWMDFHKRIAGAG